MLLRFTDLQVEKIVRSNQFLVYIFCYALVAPKTLVIKNTLVYFTVASAGSNKKKRSSGSTAAASNSGALNKAAPNGGQNGAHNTAASTGNNENKPASASKKRRTKKPFEELRRPVSQHNHSGNEGHQPQNGDHGQHQGNLLKDIDKKTVRRKGFRDLHPLSPYVLFSVTHF